MSENEKLKAQIGHIADLKTSDGPWPHTSGTPYDLSRGRGQGRGQRGWRGARFAPSTHRNRSLILNNAPRLDSKEDIEESLANPTSSSEQAAKEVTAAKSSWVMRHDRGQMQLINASVYDKDVLARARGIEQTKQQRARERDNRERARITRYLRSQASTARGTPSTELVINDIRFQVVGGGSKLLRTSDNPKSARSTPKRASVAGVTFVRSRNGNLYRLSTVKAKRAYTNIYISNHRTCKKGSSCPFIHDPAKVAICKDFLQKGSCPAGDNCDLSHDPTPERVPACLHFLRGACSKENCRYAHVRVSPDADVCRPFAVLGFCPKGSDCTERHVHECPDYANTGSCRNQKCRLPHVDRAGRLRQKNAQQGADPANRRPVESESDISSEEEDYEEIDSEDVDSDGLTDEPLLAGREPNNDDIFDQRDFVKF
ncbi:MAG: hypothetical protein M1824_004288 [Vezdaea acicularis]|nr:MAG: hypothetical protein M1824_004288 [Vezdaea acicularis]